MCMFMYVLVRTSISHPCRSMSILQVLVLGSGHVAPPLIAYLTRKATEVCVVSMEQKELNALKRMPGTGGMAMGFIDSGWIYRINQISTNMMDFVSGIYNIHKLIYIGDLCSEIKREYHRHRQRVIIIINSRHVSYIKYT